jgi:hypothetical protein
MSYVIVKITNWSDQRDSARRIAPADGGSRPILINPDRISDLIADPADAEKSIFKFFDNKLDRREKWSVIHADISVAELVAASDTAFESTMITLPIHKNNDPDAATVDTTMPVTAIAYADDYNPRVSNHCWVVYYNAAFKRREVLCNMNIKQLEGFAETGNTSTSYPGQDQGNPAQPVGSDR